MKKDGVIKVNPIDDRVRAYPDEPPLNPRFEWMCWWMRKFKTLDSQWAFEAWAETAARGYVE